jgi:hypothetical protein
LAITRCLRRTWSKDEPRVHYGAECRAERLAVELGRVVGGERGESICRRGEQDVEATGFDRVDRLL